MIPVSATAFRNALPVGLALSAIAAALGAKASPVMDKPLNVLFIASDDMRTELGCYGDMVVKSPNIDALAARGLVFERAYCQQAVCGPSRTSLLTGWRPDSIRVWDLKTYFRDTVPDIVTLPQDFKNHGYFTQDIGKIYHNDTRPLSAGPRMYDLQSWSVTPTYATGDHWRDWIVPGNPSGPKAKQGAYQCLDVPDGDYRDGRITDDAIASLRRFAAGRRPFFLAVGFWKPHLPFNAPKRFWDLYAPGDLHAPLNPRPPIGAPPIALHDSFELRSYAGIPAHGSMPPDLSGTLRHGYYACISFVDSNVGRLMKELQLLGLEDRTVVVFWGDNGFHLGEHDLWGKTTNYELDTRVPLIIAVPGMPHPGAKTRALVELVDIYPTLLEVCGLPPVKGLEGRSLVPLLADPACAGKEAVLSEHPHPFYVPKSTTMGYAVRTDRYRYVEWRDIASHAVVGRELYDYETDPYETINHINDPADASVVTHMQQLLLKLTPHAAVPAWSEWQRTDR